VTPICAIMRIGWGRSDLVADDKIDAGVDNLARAHALAVRVRGQDLFGNGLRVAP